MKLDKFDLALANAASGDTTRPALQCLHLTNGRVEATNGYILVVRDLDLAEEEEKPEALLSARMIKRIKLGNQQAILTVVDDKVTVNYQDTSGEPAEFEPSISFTTFKASNPFPKTDAVWPTAEKTAQVAVTVGQLKKLLACLPDDGIMRVGIIQREKEVASTQPIEFGCSGMVRPIRGMIMPMQVDWTEHKWLGKEASKCSE